MFALNTRPNLGRQICSLATLQLIFLTSITLATQSPSGCGFNNVVLNFGTTNNFVTNGTTVFFEANIANPPLNCGTLNASCDVTLDGSGLVFTCPGANGTPSGATATLLPGNLTLTGCTLGFPRTNYVIPCVISVAPGVLTAVATVASPGAVVHKNPLQDDNAQLIKEISVSLVQPCMQVGKQCLTATTVPGVGVIVTFSGGVTNCSPVNANSAAQNALLGIQVYNNQPVPNTLVKTIPLLLAGTFTNFTGVYTNATDLCGAFADTLTFIATVNTDTPFQITNSASSQCNIPCRPQICVTKEIACQIGPNDCGSFNKSATGFKTITDLSTNLPSFCYRITVTNCGTLGLTNVTVVDDKFGDLTADFQPCISGVFAPGESCTFVFKTTLEFDQTNTVSVTGQTASSGQVVSARDFATGHVFTAGIACAKLVTDVANNITTNHLVFQCGSGTHPIAYSVMVTNTGDADLTNVVVSDPILANLCMPPAPFSLAAGASTNILLCSDVEFDCGNGGTVSNSCGNLSLGPASAYGVLQLGNGSVTITLGGVAGDVAVGPNGKFSISGSSFVSGTLYLAHGDNFSQSGSSKIGAIVTDANLSQAINTALTVSAADAALPCTQSFATWNSSRTVTGVVGPNVICVGSVNLSGGELVTLTGPAGAKFIINVTGGFSGTGSSQIRVAGGVQPQDVIYNVIGAGNTIALNGGSAVDGTLLAPQRGVTLSIGVTHGQVIAGGNIVIQSGAKVQCPGSSTGCTPVSGFNTVTIMAQVSPVQTNALSVCVNDTNGQPIIVSSQCSAVVECSRTPTNPPTTCPPVTSFISSGFNGTPISTNNDIWFNANLSAKGIPASGATIRFQNSTINIVSANGTFTYGVPDSQIIFSPNVSCATTLFDGTQWVTTVPITGSDEILLSALGISAPADVKAAKVTWTGTFTASTNGISVSWKWGAAVYTTDMTEAQYNNLQVKPTHSGACNYNNGDHAGTPESVKGYVIGGARGGGGANFTGSWSGTVSAPLCPP